MRVENCPIWKVVVPGKRAFTIYIPTPDPEQVDQLTHYLGGLGEAPKEVSAAERTFQWMQARPPSALAKEEMFGQIARQLATGMNILDSLRSQGRDNRNLHLRRVSLEIARSLMAGVDPASAFAAHPKVFSQEEITGISAGFRAGSPEKAFAALSRQARTARQIGAALKKAAMQPVITVMIAYGAIVAISFKLVPTLKDMFQKAPELPTITKAQIALSDYLLENPWMAGAPLGVLLLLFMARNHLARMRWFTLMMDRLPVLGLFIRRGKLARLTQTMAMLFESGVPPTEVIHHSQTAVADPRVTEALEMVESQMKEGAPMSRAFTQFVADVGKESVDILQAIQAGERSGLAQELVKVGTRMEEEYMEMSQNIAKPMEMAMTLVVGLIVGVIIYGIVVPLASMGDALSGV